MAIQKNKSAVIMSLLTLILLGFIWGTGYSIARFAMTHEVPPLGYSFWQSIGPAIIIGLITLIKNKSLAIKTNNLIFFIITGLTGIVIPNTTMYFAASHLPASILAIIVNTVPIVAYPMALLSNLEKFDWQRMLGILLAFIGLILIIAPKSSLPSPNLIPWVLLTLITPFSFAFCSIYISRYRPQGSNTLMLTAGMLILSSLLLIPLVLYTHSFYLFHLPFSLPGWIIVLEIILSSIGYLLFFHLLKIAGPVFYSLVDTIVVITGIFWGYVIFSEHLTIWMLSAVLLIIFALLLVTRRQRMAARK